MLGRAAPWLAARAARTLKPMVAPQLQCRSVASFTRWAAPLATANTNFSSHVIPAAKLVDQTKISSPLPRSKQTRNFSMWRLRPYAHSGVNLGGTSLLAPGYSQVTMTALTVSVLPSALFIAPAVMAASALTRVFSEPKHTWTAVYHGVVQFAIGFLPIPCYENLFTEMTFYAMTLFFMCAVYQLFPELMLNDFIVMHFLAMFTVSLLPVIWSFMPLFNARSYLTYVH